MIEYLNDEQIAFVCKECKITKKQLAEGTEEDFRNWCDTICSIECDAVDYEDDSPRIIMAESILDSLSDFDEDEEDEQVV